MKDCIICTKDDKRERNLFFAKLLADMTLRALKNALDGIFQTLRRAKQRCERRNRKEEIKVTSKHFNCRIQFVQQFISSYISTFYTLLTKVKDSLISASRNPVINDRSLSVIKVFGAAKRGYSIILKYLILYYRGK